MRRASYFSVHPRSTYRVQLRPEFDFGAAADRAGYLGQLGVSHLYCSPYLQAMPGSSHGYDVADHARLNAELGGEEGHAALVAALTEAGLGQVVDVVPNHMAVGGRANRWWWDVLENGPASAYAECFDIDWWGDDKDGPSVLVPVLGDHYGRVLEAGELRVVREGGGFLVRYHEHELPLSLRSLASLLEGASQRCASEALREVVAQSAALPPLAPVTPEDARQRHLRNEALHAELGRLSAQDPAVARALDEEAEAISADPDALDALLSQQRYRLAFWRTANEEIDYRRFFNIETLIGLRIETPRVFDEVHRRILELVETGAVHGLRIDHIDGLRDPLGYLQRLREKAGSTYLVVEKILELSEGLPAEWPVQGTTGYDFIANVSNLLVDEGQREPMDACYAGFVGEPVEYEHIVLEAKKHVMSHVLRAEVDGLARRLSHLCERYRRQRDHTDRTLREAVCELLASFDVYRTYVRSDGAVSALDRQRVRDARDRTVARRPDIDRELLDWICALALLEQPGREETDFALRFAQVSAPVMAKGVEDTAFYRYQRLISLNEVGGDPGVFGLPVEAFHAAMRERAERWPTSMLTLSTHDTKRSGDVRARLHVLAELPEAWSRACARLREIAAPHRQGPWPDPHTEYMLYQTLVGAWPLPADRVLAFVEKATREAKRHTSWVNPDPAYDQATAEFCRSVLGDAAFVSELERFVSEHDLVTLGRMNALAQTALLLTCPGVPDIYQGSELWDLSLMDPDNRRPVDYALREGLLESVLQGDPLPTLADDTHGVLKLKLVATLLRHRRERPAHYASRSYAALPASGSRARHVVAFARGDLVVAVPRLPYGSRDGFGDTVLPLPPGRFRRLLGGEPCEGRVPADALFGSFPVAVLEREEK